MVSGIKIQVVGFPGATYRRLKNDLAEWAGKLPADTTIRFVQSRHDRLPQIEQPEVNQIGENIQAGFVHIGVLPTRHFAALRPFQFDCRVIKLAVPSELERLTIADTVAALTQAIEYEQRWCKVAQPDSWNHPLWLPPPSFDVVADLREYWSRCDCYKNTEQLTAANNTLQGVISRYRRSQRGIGHFWVDEKAKQFTPDRSLHGMTPEERAGRRKFRFTKEVPPGFHYDVVRHSGGKFSICSTTDTHHGCGRVNVNPWGMVHVKA